MNLSITCHVWAGQQMAAFLLSFSFTCQELIKLPLIYLSLFAPSSGLSFKQTKQAGLFSAETFTVSETCLKITKEKKWKKGTNLLSIQLKQRGLPKKNKWNLLWVWREACTKQGWSVSFSSSWVKAISPACSIKPRLSATWAANASPRFCRAASRAWVSEAWRSARAAVRSLMLWASCSRADTLFTCRCKHEQKKS